jgi:hypothetical protein
MEKMKVFYKKWTVIGRSKVCRREQSTDLTPHWQRLCLVWLLDEEIVVLVLQKHLLWINTLPNIYMVGYYATSRKVAGSSPYEVTDLYQCT